MAKQYEKKNLDIERVLAIASNIADELKAQGTVIQNSGRIPSELIERMRREGLFKILQPAVFGGLELDPITFFEVQRVLSKNCMSAGWVMGILGLQSWQLGLFSAQAQKDVWGNDQNVTISSSFMPAGKVKPVEDGFILSGQWRYSSASPYSAWALLGGIVTEEGKSPDYRAFLLPCNDYQIVDDWNTIGLRATESQGIKVESVFVPAYRTFSTIDGFRCDCPGNTLNTNSLYRIPFGQLFALTIALPAVGALEGGISHILQTLPVIPRLSLQDTAPSSMQLALAEASAVANECRMIARRNLQQLITLAEDRAVPSVQERVRMRLDAARISNKCVQVVNRLFNAWGTRSIMVNDPLGQAWLDINAASLHAGNNIDRFEANFSNVLLGREIKDNLI